MIFGNRVKKISILAMVGALALSIGACKSKENTEYADLESYFEIEQVGQYDGAAVIVDGRLSGAGFVKDGYYYINYQTVREKIDDHYYFDETEKILTYASSKHIYDAVSGQLTYAEDGKENTAGTEPVLWVDESAYISIDYIKIMNGGILSEAYSEPHRVDVKVNNQVTLAKATEATVLRTDKGVGYPIVADISKDAELYIVSDGDTWTKVCNEDGIMGYIENGKLGESYEKTWTLEKSWMEYEPYTYLTMDEKVCLGWHQMEYEGGNDSLSSLIKGADGLNVISPTWFEVTDIYGGISSLASKNYVDKAHKSGIQVWGLISDFIFGEDGNSLVNKALSVTSSRRKLIDNIMEEATACGMDGINIDFENIRRVYVEGYVQFIRELAIECESAGLVLSVDMYVPREDNQYYDRESVGEAVDYLVIMGYDEHWAGCNQAGSVASLPYVTNGITDTLLEVPASRVINAIPFFTRVWYEDSLENAPDGAVIVEDAINGDYALSSKAYGLETARKLLEDNGANIVWLEDLGQHYGEYYADGRLSRIWLEDKASLTAKLNVMKSNNLAGVACWRLGLESTEAWEAIGEFLK